MTVILEANAEGGDPAAETVRTILLGSGQLMEVLRRCAELALPQWYLAAGCVTQTVWNHLTGRPLDADIRDYDLIYFDDSDLSWDAENDVIKKAAGRFHDLPIEVEVRNQARVHLWYEERFGKPCPAHTGTESAIDTFPATATSIGVRLEPDGSWRFYAPFGFADLMDLIVRPNLKLAPPEVIEKKARRWQECWPELQIKPTDQTS
jgi:uncharacterized protein